MNKSGYFIKVRKFGERSCLLRVNVKVSYQQQTRLLIITNRWNMWLFVSLVPDHEILGPLCGPWSECVRAARQTVMADSFLIPRS